VFRRTTGTRTPAIISLHRDTLIWIRLQRLRRSWGTVSGVAESSARGKVSDHREGMILGADDHDTEVVCRREGCRT
jgi:hypothetical protein